MCVCVCELASLHLCITENTYPHTHTHTLTVDLQVGAMCVRGGPQGTAVQEALVQPTVLQQDRAQAEVMTPRPLDRLVLVNGHPRVLQVYSLGEAGSIDCVDAVDPDVC